MLEEVLAKAKDPASGMIEKIDTEIRERITTQVQTSSKSLFRDVIALSAFVQIIIGMGWILFASPKEKRFFKNNIKTSL